MRILDFDTQGQRHTITLSISNNTSNEKSLDRAFRVQVLSIMGWETVHRRRNGLFGRATVIPPRSSHIVEISFRRQLCHRRIRFIKYVDGEAVTTQSLYH
ncbi:MAG: hypothetical protein FWE06_04325 [Oscillospiraceae bacterium]|nr:hypothetical protein [Oscillospiraceae bacterium]